MDRLTVEDLHVTYRSSHGAVRAVDGVSFELALGGEALGVIGESGSGKSSLARALMRLLPKSASVAGRMQLGELDLGTMSDERFRVGVRWRRLAMVPQSAMHALNPVLRVGEQLAECWRLDLDGVGRREALRRSGDLLEQVGLGARTGMRYPHELSGGMRQRAMIAMALALEPAVLILDEPTSALDVSIQAQIMNLLKRLRRERGVSMLFITHDLALASDLCDGLGVLYAGQLREIGGADEVLTAPNDPYTRALLASIPRLHGGTRPTFLPGAPPDPRAPSPGCRFQPRCPVAFEPCREHAPALVEVGAGPRARCWLYQPLPDGVGLASEESANGAAGADRGTSSAAPPGAMGAPARGVSRPPTPSVPEGAPVPVTVSAASPAGPPLVRLEGVSLYYWVRRGLFGNAPVKALEQVDLTLDRGESVAVVGESGSGKSTLGRALLRLGVPLRGRVVFDGQDVTALPEAGLRGFRRQVQAVFQDPYASLSPYMRVFDQVEEPLVVHGPPSRKARRERVLAALEQVKLRPASEFVELYPHTLSGGQRQRVSIARAMVLEPQLLVADEPVSMIDASSRAEILYLLRELQEGRDLTVLNITHDLASARHFADRIVVMYLGRVVELGPARRVIESPKHPYTRGLLAAVPEPDPANRHRLRSVIEGEPPSALQVPSGCPFHTRCPEAMPGICDVTFPAVTHHGEGHDVACHLYPAEDDGAKAEFEGGDAGA